MTPPRHLLMVEDDRLVLSTISSGLRQRGYRVSTAESADDAQAWLAGGERPDLAILDVRMPGTDGLELATRLTLFDRVPFMMLSAYSEPATVARATEIGALGYAVKPMEIAQLVPAVEAALARADEMRALRTTGQQLQRALDAERNISVATGIVMAEYRLGRGDAFALLRDTARARRQKLLDVADAVVSAREDLNVGAARHVLGDIGRPSNRPA